MDSSLFLENRLKVAIVNALDTYARMILDFVPCQRKQQ